MEEEETKTEGLEDEVKDIKDHLTDFVETYIELSTIKIAKKTIEFISSLVNLTILAFLFFLFIFFVGFGAAWWLGALLNSRAGGFFIIAGVYLLCMFFFMALGKKTIIPLLRNVMTRLIYG